MNTCQKFKTIENYKCEDCLLQVTYTQHRITLTNLRLSNHKLTLETDRYLRPYKKNLNRIKNVSKFVNLTWRTNITELYMPFLPGKTNALFDNLKNGHLIRVNKMSPNEIFMLFLINISSENSETPKIIARHVFECFKIRNEKEDKE